MQAVFEENRDKLAYALFDEILEFCIYSSACKTLNLSFADFMAMDYATYQRIRKKIELRDKKINEEHKAVIQKQEKLNEEVKNARAKYNK